MCYYITVAIPCGSTPKLMSQMTAGLRLDRHENKSILKMVPESAECYLITNGEPDHRCSCQLYRSAEGEDDHRLDPVAARVRRYQKKGWSESKIERAVAAMRAEAARQRFEEFQGIRHDVRSVISRLVESHTPVHILVHWYDGDVQTEVVKGLALTVSRKAFNDPRYRLPEDTLVEIS